MAIIQPDLILRIQHPLLNEVYPGNSTELILLEPNNHSKWRVKLTRANDVLKITATLDNTDRHSIKGDYIHVIPMNGGKPMLFDFSDKTLPWRNYSASFHIQSETVYHDNQYGFYLVLSKTKDLPEFFCASTGKKRSTLPSYEEAETTAPEEAQITVYADFPQEKWCYLKHKASGLVLNVEHGFGRDHTKPLANIVLNHQKLCGSAARHALLELQLWCFESGYIVNRRTGLVLDVDNFRFKTGTQIIQWSRRSHKNVNQQWAISDGLIHPKGYPNLVLDVDAKGTRICLYERKEIKNLEQRWSFEAATFSWMTPQTNHTNTTDDRELLEEYEASRLGHVKVNQVAHVDSWVYLKSDVSELSLKDEQRSQGSSLKDAMSVFLRDIYSVDTQFIFGPASQPSDTRLWAHRSVLAKYPVFDGLLKQASFAYNNSIMAPLDVSVTKVSFAVFATLLKFVYTNEVERTNYPNQFAISKFMGRTQVAEGGPKDNYRWHPLDLDTPLSDEAVTWQELLDAARIYKVDALQARCEAALKGIAKVGMA